MQSPHPHGDVQNIRAVTASATSQFTMQVHTHDHPARCSNCLRSGTELVKACVGSSPVGHRTPLFAGNAAQAPRRSGPAAWWTAASTPAKPPSMNSFAALTMASPCNAQPTFCGFVQTWASVGSNESSHCAVRACAGVPQLCFRPRCRPIMSQVSLLNHLCGGKAHLEPGQASHAEVQQAPRGKLERCQMLDHIWTRVVHRARVNQPLGAVLFASRRRNDDQQDPEISYPSRERVPAIHRRSRRSTYVR